MTRGFRKAIVENPLLALIWTGIFAAFVTVFAATIGDGKLGADTLTGLFSAAANFAVVFTFAYISYYQAKEREERDANDRREDFYKELFAVLAKRGSGIHEAALEAKTAGMTPDRVLELVRIAQLSAGMDWTAANLKAEKLAKKLGITWNPGGEAVKE